MGSGLPATWGLFPGETQPCTSSPDCSKNQGFKGSWKCDTQFPMCICSAVQTLFLNLFKKNFVLNKTINFFFLFKKLMGYFLEQLDPQQN